MLPRGQGSLQLRIRAGLPPICTAASLQPTVLSLTASTILTPLPGLKPGYPIFSVLTQPSSFHLPFQSHPGKVVSYSAVKILLFWFDLGWWAHSATSRSCITEMYNENLYDPMNQCHPNEFNFKILLFLESPLITSPPPCSPPDTHSACLAASSQLCAGVSCVHICLLCQMRSGMGFNL